MGSLGGDNGGVKAGQCDGIEEQVIGQGEDLVIITGAGIVVWAAGQGICAVRGARFMEEADVVVTKGQDIVCKVAVNFLGASIILEVLVVGEDIDDEFST